MPVLSWCPVVLGVGRVPAAACLSAILADFRAAAARNGEACDYLDWHTGQRESLREIEPVRILH